MAESYLFRAKRSIFQQITARNRPRSLSRIMRWKSGRRSVLPVRALSMYSPTTRIPFLRAKS